LATKIILKILATKRVLKTTGHKNNFKKPWQHLEVVVSVVLENDDVMVASYLIDFMASGKET
jgi:hypothetical protein